VAQGIVTLPNAQISRFLVRHRRGETLERFQPQLDAFLREILAKADEFVPSESGAILLDDPRAKMFDQTSNQLTVIAAFGEWAERMLGQRLSTEKGLAGRVYSSGEATRCMVEEEERAYYTELDVHVGTNVHSLLGVPVLLGSSICGVLLLINRKGRETFSEDEHKLIEIFAGYISSSIQNTLDGLRARELAQRDDLTGLHNDRYLHQRLRVEIRRADRDQNELSLLFLDLDHFKSINDVHGHLEGILLENEIPQSAIAARYGGDEFVVILPGASTAQALEAAEHLRERLCVTPFAVDRPDYESPIYLSASLGVASLREHVAAGGRSAGRANQLIRMADSAMYRAKAEGRNRVVLAVAENTREEESR
jgi:diguanylate cyclase (GGDEF)-like protein